VTRYNSTFGVRVAAISLPGLPPRCFSCFVSHADQSTHRRRQVHLDGVLTEGGGGVASVCDRNPMLYSLMKFHRCKELRRKLFNCWVGEELQRLHGLPVATLSHEDREVRARPVQARGMS